MRAVLALLVLLLVPAAARAEMRLPPGFTAEVYVAGAGEGPDGRAAVGIPSISSLAFDAAGTLYTARSGRRYIGGEVEDLWPLFRFPLGGAGFVREAAAQHYGRPLCNVQIGAVRGGRELLVTTYDRDRALGVLYRIVDGRAELLAGGTPPPGEPPLLKQPEGVALDAAGHIYVADRPRGAVLKLDPNGRVLDPRWVGPGRRRRRAGPASRATSSSSSSGAARGPSTRSSASRGPSTT